MLDVSTIKITGRNPIVTLSLILACYILFSFAHAHASTSEARLDLASISTYRTGTKRFMFRTIAGHLSFSYIADDGPNNLPSRVDLIGGWLHISKSRSACRF